MLLDALNLTHFRNFDALELGFSEGVNVFYGKNGVGKTSVLEALCLFGLGRSSRGSAIKHLVANHQNIFQVSASLSLGGGFKTRLIAVGNHRNGLKFSIDSQVSLVADVVQQLPTQLMCCNSFQILEAGPVYRRQFLDWGCFFFEPGFVRVWQRFGRALKQRNRLLKSPVFNDLYRSALGAWEQEFLHCAHAIEEARQHYCAVFWPELLETMKRFLPGLSFEFSWFRGWGDEGLAPLLHERLARDRLLGYTSVGPHRGDFDVLVNGVSAKQVLSRGQVKLLVCAMLIARTTVLARYNQRPCLMMIDDVVAELDQRSLHCLLDNLLGLGSQILLTSIEPLKGLPGVLSQALAQTPLERVWA